MIGSLPRNGSKGGSASGAQVRRWNFAVESSYFQKFLLTPPPNQLHLPPHPVPLEGRIRIVRDAGRGAVDAAALGVKRDGRAGSKRACERSNGALTNGALPGETFWQ
jgi:hypothetical protein